MGRFKDHYFEEINSEIEAWKFSNILGIPYEDVEELEWEIEIDSSKDGLIYNYRVVFSEDSPKEILQRITRLEDGHTVYLHPWEYDEEYDIDEQFEAITDNKELFQKYKNEISNLTNLNALKVEHQSLRDTLNRQIFIGVIGALEAFLSETFINLVVDNDNYRRNFVKSYPAFKKRKFELREIFEENDKLVNTIKDEMLLVIYHNLPKVSNMYRDTFQIDFPDITDVYECVLKRHDLVHRNGKTKTGEVVEANQESIGDLIKKVNRFVEAIVKELNI